jgi:hypothetical protein
MVYTFYSILVNRYTACSKKMWYIFLRPSPSLGRRRLRVRVMCLVTVEQAVANFFEIFIADKSATFYQNLNLILKFVQTSLID